MEMKIFAFWGRVVLSLFIIVLSYGVVSPQLVSMPSDFGVLIGYTNVFVITPIILYALWRGFFK